MVGFLVSFQIWTSVTNENRRENLNFCSRVIYLSLSGLPYKLFLQRIKIVRKGYQNNIQLVLQTGWAIKFIIHYDLRMTYHSHYGLPIITNCHLDWFKLFMTRIYVLVTKRTWFVSSALVHWTSWDADTYMHLNVSNALMHWTQFQP